MNVGGVVRGPAQESEPAAALLPYLPRMVVEWAVEAPATRWREIEGSLVFADLSGFTKMSERLSRLGKMGAEEVTDAINTCFTALLEIAYDDGGGLVKFGGDALLLVYTGDGHVERATRSAVGMRARLRTVGRIATSAGLVTLRMSVGVHSGKLHCFLVGGSSRELLLTGAGVSEVIAMEHDASAGQILVSPATANALPESCRGEPRGPGVLLSRAAPWPPPTGPLEVPEIRGVDLGVFLPDAVREHVLEGGGEPQHRTVTVGFVHFDGLDQRLVERGPEATADDLEELVGVVQDACARYEVAVLATDADADGGKFVLAAGAPRARGGDDARMLGAARAIVDAHTEISVRIGVHRGPVFTGDVGPRYRRTHTVMGDTVNLAARLMAAAEPGHILCTAIVLDRAPAFVGRPLAPLHVKGKRAAVEAFDIGAARGRGARPDRAADRQRLPFVGRVAELGRLMALVEAVRAGEGRGAHVLGPSGTGKSRLVEELRERAPDLPAAVVACEAYEASTPYAPVNVLIHDVLGLTFDDPPEVVAQRIEERVRALAPQLLPWMALLGVPLELDLPDTDESRTLAPQFRPARVADVTIDFLQAVLPGPRLVVFENVQWMDEASRALLERAIARAGDDRWMIVCTGYESAEPFADVETMILSPLEAHEAADALRRAVATRPLRPHEIDAIVARADGSPLFLTELYAVAGGRSEAGSLPESVESLVTTQIDMLPPRRRMMLSYAAVLGRSFALAELQALIGEDAAATDTENLFGLSEFIDFDPATSRCQFRHGLLRDTAYEMLAFRRRRELHGRVARMLESALDGHPELEAELLSLHYLHARSYAEAWRFARLAGERARDKYANVDAATLFERALTAARALPEVDAFELAAVWEALGDVRDRSGEFEAAVAAYLSARRLVRDDPIRESGVLLKVAWIPERVGRYSDAVRWIRKGQRILEHTTGTEAARRRAQLAAWYAAIRQAQGRSREAITWCRTALDEAAVAGDLAAEAHASFILDWAYVESGRPDLATHSARALEIYEQLGDLNAKASVLNNLGGFAYYEGRWDDAVDHYAQAREAWLRSGNATDAATGLTNIGEVLGDQGRLVEARDQVLEALHVYRATGYRWGMAWATSLLGRIAARAGDFDEAHRHLEEAAAAFRAASLDSDLAQSEAWIAEAFALAGDADAALARADAVVRHASDGDGLGVLAPLLARVRGLALMQQGNRAESRAAFDVSIAAARERGADYELALSLHALARLSELDHSADRAADHAADHAALVSESAVIFERLGVQLVAEPPAISERTRDRPPTGSAP